jgi:hypothetical protein
VVVCEWCASRKRCASGAQVGSGVQVVVCR